MEALEAAVNEQEEEGDPDLEYRKFKADQMSYCMLISCFSA